MKAVVDHFAFLNRRELERVMDGIDSNVLQEFRGPKPAELTGADAFRATVVKSFAQGEFLNIRKIVVDGPQVAVALEREQSGRGKSAAKPTDEAHVFLVKDGKIKKITSYVFDPQYFY